MARGQRKQEKEAQAQKAEAPKEEKAPATDEIRYPVDVYLDNARAMLGTTKYALAGALHGQEEPEGGYTKSELKALLDSFSNRPLT